MLKNRQFQQYNDGSAVIYQDKTEEEDGIVRNVKKLSTLTKICEMEYANASIREEDTNWANAQEVTLTKKIKVQQSGLVHTGMYAVTEGTLYYIQKADPSNDGMSVFLYLTEARKNYGE